MCQGIYIYMSSLLLLYNILNNPLNDPSDPIPIAYTQVSAKRDGHKGAITSVCFSDPSSSSPANSNSNTTNTNTGSNSSGGHVIATAGVDGVVKTWDVESGQLRHTLGDRSTSTSIEISPIHALQVLPTNPSVFITIGGQSHYNPTHQNPSSNYSRGSGQGQFCVWDSRVGSEPTEVLNTEYGLLSLTNGGGGNNSGSERSDYQWCAGSNSGTIHIWDLRYLIKHKTSNDNSSSLWWSVPPQTVSSVVDNNLSLPEDSLIPHPAHMTRVNNPNDPRSSEAITQLVWDRPAGVLWTCQPSLTSLYHHRLQLLYSDPALGMAGMGPENPRGALWYLQPGLGVGSAAVLQGKTLAAACGLDRGHDGY